MQQIFMYMNSMLAGVDINTGAKGFWNMFSGGLSAAFSSLLYGLLTLVCKVLGIFADVMNAAFYIFSGIDLTSDNGKPLYQISVAGESTNILDYFVLSETVRNAYVMLSLASVILIVIFTIYKIVKQDYFEKAGPRSKGPIFRNVAISCISFILVIPIFWIIIHASSLLAVVVMDMMGLNASELAGAKVFALSWSDGGDMVRYVNEVLSNGRAEAPYQLKKMMDLDDRTLFALMSEKKNLEYATNLGSVIENAYSVTGFGPNESISEFGIMIGSRSVSGEFYWYIYIVGIIISIKALYKMLLAMLQRIFKLMGLFLVAPSPISQYVLDDGQKFKSWLQESIQEGLRLVSATMSFSIYLMVLSLITDISFVEAFKTSLSPSETTVVTNVNLLSYDNVESVMNLPMVAEMGKAEKAFYGLADAFLKIFMLIGAGGAITDLDGVLTPLISGGKTSLDSGATGQAAGKLVSGTMNVAGKLAGGVVGGVTQAFKNRNAESDGVTAGRKKADEDGTSKPDGPKGGNGPNGGSGGSDGSGGSGDPKDKDENGVNAPQENGQPGQENQKDENKENENDQNVENQNGNNSDNKEGKDGEENSDNKDGNDKNDGNSGQNAPKPGDKAANGKKIKPIQGLMKRIGEKVNSGKDKFASGINKIKKGANGLGEKIKNKGGVFNEIAGAAVGGLIKAGGGALKGLGAIAGGLARGLGHGLKAGWKSAKSQIGTAVFGESTAKAFAETRGTAEAAENKHAAKRYESGMQQGYADRREEQLQAAEENVNKKKVELDKSTEGLNNAVEQEQQAKEEVDRAKGQAGVDGVMAEEANTKAAEKSGAGEAKKRIADSKELKKISQEENNKLQAKYGDRDSVKAQLKIAKKSGNEQETKKLQAVLDQYDNNDEIIKQADRDIGQAEAKLQAIDTVSGKNGKIQQLLGDKAKDASYTDVQKVIKEKLNSKDLSDKDRQELEMVQSQMNSVGAKTYNSAENKKAREANITASNSKVAYEKAVKNYDAKHNETVKAREEVKNKLNAFNNATKVIDTLNAATDKSGYANVDEDSAGGVDKDGNYKPGSRKGIVQEGRAKAMNRRKKKAKAVVEKANNSLIAANNAQAVDVQLSASTSIGDVLNNYEKQNNQDIKNSEQKRDAAVAAAGNKLKGQQFKYTVRGSDEIQSMSLDEFVDKDGNVDTERMRKTISLYKNDEDIRFVGGDRQRLDDVVNGYHKDVSNAHKAHDTVVKDVNSRNARIDTARNVIKAAGGASMNEHQQVTDQIENNTQRAVKVSNEINAMDGVIENGGKGIDASTRRMINNINKVNGKPQIDSHSDAEAVVQAAKDAKNAKNQELNGIMKETGELQKESQSIASALSSMITSALQAAGIKLDVKPVDTGKGNSGQKDNTGNGGNNGNDNGKGGNGTPNVSGPNNSNINNVNNNNINVVNEENDNGLPASSGLGQSTDLNSYYERVQVESIKHMQLILETVRKRNEQIIDDLGIIKRDIHDNK